MIQGTTPVLHFNLPFSASLIKSAEILLKYIDSYKSVLIVKNLEDCELGETSIAARLTQEETLALPAPAIASVQLRVLTTDDIALATDLYKISVKRLLREDVIE